MPGSGRLRIAWVWKKKPPLYWSVLVVALWFYWMAWIIGPYFFNYVTTPIPCLKHSHALTVGGGVRYMNPLLWWCYDKGGWICGVLFLLLIFITFLKRDQLERVR
ncbi:MAG: hypothetical protein WA621_02465 [Candidatus Acidiferrum sp.]|jgi:hypothetical protein